MTGPDPIFPASLIVALVGGAMLLAVWREIRLWRTRKSGKRWTTGGLRLISLALLAMIFLNPSAKVEQEAEPIQPLVLIDASDSMRLPSSSGEKTRWEEALRFAEKIQEGSPGYPVMGFADRLISELPGREIPGGATRLAQALEQLLTSSGQQGNPVIILSDGRIQDDNQLGRVLSLAKQSGVLIATHCVGSDHEIRNARLVSVRVPEIVRPQAKVTMEVVTSTSGFDGGELELVLLDEDGKEVASKTIPSGGERKTYFKFEGPLDRADYQLELRAEGEPEATLDDNRLAVSVPVASRNLRVLIVEGSHSLQTIGEKGHAWNQIEYITRAWELSGEIDFDVYTVQSQYHAGARIIGASFSNGQIIVDPGRTFPTTEEEVQKYDVIMISDIPRSCFSDEQMTWVLEWVRQRGGGFLMGGGSTSFDAGGYDQTIWERLIPVDVKSYGGGLSELHFTPSIPKSAVKHPVWQLLPDPKRNQDLIGTLPIFYGMNRVSRAKPGALVLANRTVGQSVEPVLAVQSYGRGRTFAFLADPNGFWGQEWIRWGSTDEMKVGPQVDLHRNRQLYFNAEAAEVPPDPPTAHPSPNYAQLWINIVKWLGEKSIRWRNDSMEARALLAFATPGEELPVAVELLGSAGLDELYSANVGVRLAKGDGKRTRLSFNRDQRQFIGALEIPDDFTGEFVELIFDSSQNDRSVSEILQVGILRADPEATEGESDPGFMNELAIASGGRSLTDVADAREFLKESELAQKHQETSLAEPLWPQWPLWGLFAGSLLLEYLIRRRERIQLTAEI